MFDSLKRKLALNCRLTGICPYTIKRESIEAELISENRELRYAYKELQKSIAFLQDYNEALIKEREAIKQSLSELGKTQQP